MPPAVTPRSEHALRGLLRVAKEIDDQVLAAASAEARSEWNALLDRLPPETDPRRGAFDDDELERLLTKALRFREILSALPAPLSP